MGKINTLEVMGIEYDDISSFQFYLKKENQKLVLYVESPSEIDDLLSGFYLSQDTFCGTFTTSLNDTAYCEGCTVLKEVLNYQSTARTYTIDLPMCSITFNTIDLPMSSITFNKEETFNE